MSKIRYDEKFTSRRIIKLRKADQSEDLDSVHYVPDEDLDEAISRVGFSLDQVEGFEEYLDSFNKFHNKRSKLCAVSLKAKLHFEKKERITFSFFRSFLILFL